MGISEVGATRLLKLHRITIEALSHSITEQEQEILRLKKRMNELEDALNPKLMFMTSLAIKALDSMEYTPITPP